MRGEEIGHIVHVAVEDDPATFWGCVFRNYEPAVSAYLSSFADIPHTSAEASLEAILWENGVKNVVPFLSPSSRVKTFDILIAPLQAE